MQYDQISSNFLEMNSESNGTIYFSNKFADFYLFTWNIAQQPAYNVYTKIKIKNEIKYIFVNFGILFKFGFIDWIQCCFDSLWTKSLKIISNSLKLEHCVWQTHCTVQRAFFKNKKIAIYIEMPLIRRKRNCSQCGVDSSCMEHIRTWNTCARMHHVHEN